MQDAGDQSYMVTEIKESGLSSRHSCSFLCHPFHFGFSPYFFWGVSHWFFRRHIVKRTAI